jgi:hypothetical protein
MARNIIFHMGFLNTPYTKQNIAAPVRAAKAVRAQPRRGFTKTMTAEDVGDILENKYNILEVFSQIHGEEIMELAHESFTDVIVKTLSEYRKPVSQRMVDYMQPKTREVEKMFKSFIRMEEMNGIPGVPTNASITGKGRRSRRAGPSFIDTGIYLASFYCRADIK